MKLLFSRQAKECFCSLPPAVKTGIKSALKSLKLNPYLGKPLQREVAGFYSLAFKRHRIVYKIMAKDQIINIYTIDHRKKVYEQLSLQVQDKIKIQKNKN